MLTLESGRHPVHGDGLAELGDAASGGIGAAISFARSKKLLLLEAQGQECVGDVFAIAAVDAAGPGPRWR